MPKARSIIAAVLSASIYFIVIAAISIFSVKFTPWAVPHARDIQLLGVGISYQQIGQTIIGLPLFVYGALLVRKTTAVNHTAQNREARKPDRLLVHDVYAIRRHPMYTGFICLQAGLWFGACSLLGYIVGSIIILIVSMNSKREETSELELLFPGEYQKYKIAVPRRILTPRLTAYFLLIFLLTIVSIVLIIFG